MPDDSEHSESGAPVYRHKSDAPNNQAPPTDQQTLERIEAHLDRHIGRHQYVFHEIVSEYVHLDLHIMQPTPRHNYYTVVTTGMSDRPMSVPDAVPDGAEALRYAELMLCLPTSWQLTQEAFEDEANYWPLRWLKILARLPHQYNTWLGMAHTIPTDDPPQPFAPNTKLCCAMIAGPLLFDDDFSSLVINETKTINFYSIIPLYREEMDFKLTHGAEALFDRLDAAGVTELLDINRLNTCP